MNTIANGAIERHSANTKSSLSTRHFMLSDIQIPYHFGAECTDKIVDYIASLDSDKVYIVTDDTVRSIHKYLVESIATLSNGTVLSHPSGEGMKSVEVLSQHLRTALETGATRRSVIVSVGGGVPGNLAGVIATLLFRGVRLVHIPTTTVSAMDSVLSLKQALNGPTGKNQIGSYHAATAVLTDVRLLQTLPQDQLISGYCEMAKNTLAILPKTLTGLLAIIDSKSYSTDESLLWLLEESIRAKSLVTEFDAKEKGTGLILEYGHTVGHAIETASNLGLTRDNPRSHGACVAFGMLVAARISHNRGWMTDSDLDTHYDIVSRLGVPTTLPSGSDIALILRLVLGDNKRGYIGLRDDQAALVLLKGLGSPAFSGDLPLVAVTVSEISLAIEQVIGNHTPVSSRDSVGGCSTRYEALE